MKIKADGLSSNFLDQPIPERIVTPEEIEELYKYQDEEPEEPKKKIRFNKKLVVFIVILNVIFTIAVFYASLQQAIIPDSLIIAWYAFTTTELLAMAGIKMRGDNE